MTREEALTAVHETAVLWAVGYANAADVVRAACEALAVGADGPALCTLAAVSLRQADQEIRAVLPDALNELGLPYYCERTVTARSRPSKCSPRGRSAVLWIPGH